LRQEYYKSVEKLNEDLKEFRRSTYRSKLDKAKKDYMGSSVSAGDTYTRTDCVENKCSLLNDAMRKHEAPRGPYLEYLGKTGSLHSLMVGSSVIQLCRLSWLR